MENNIIEKKNEVSASERFTSMVFREFGANAVGEPQITDHQRSLISNYFIVIDRVLKTAEADRVARNEKNTNHQYDNNLPVSWKTVNMTDLALDLVHFARMGLDMMQPNMLFPIPYKNNKAQKYDITLMKGYNGIFYMAQKYAVEAPKAITVEVVYSTDHFKPLKRNFERSVEAYEFEITNPFDRGEIIGGFAYIEYDEPAKNKLVMMSKKDIEKRKPARASENFWGKWEDEMVRKTLVREACSAKYIPIDPAKVDEAYRAAKLREVRYAEIEADAEAEQNANRTVIDVTPEESTVNEEVIILDPQSGEVTEAAETPLF
jgi:recombination protein RecT